METRLSAPGQPHAAAARAAGWLPRAVALAGLVVFAACTSDQSQMDAAADMLPPPQVVVVDRFAVSASEVQLDEGLSTDIEQAIKADRGTSYTEQERQAAHAVTDAIADKLVIEIRDMGLKAERGSAVPAGIQNAVLITGEVISVDEGNRTERVIVGLGAGRSDVRAHARVFEVTPAGRKLIDTIEVDAKSGLTPGMAETMGAGAVAGHLLVSAAVSGGLHVVSESVGADVVADADRSAKGIAKQLARLFAEQGWTTH